MNKYDEREFLIKLGELEDDINIQKCWIEIANAVISSGEPDIFNIGLIIEAIEGKNIELYKKFENIIHFSLTD